MACLGELRRGQDDAKVVAIKGRVRAPYGGPDMDAPSLTDWITAGGTLFAAVAAIVAAGAAIATAWIADRAATTWRDALQNQRYDECVAAAVELQAAINRYISAVKGKDKAR